VKLMCDGRMCKHLDLTPEKSCCRSDKATRKCGELTDLSRRTPCRPDQDRICRCRGSELRTDLTYIQRPAGRAIYLPIQCLSSNSKLSEVLVTICPSQKNGSGQAPS
jgi:hypothetical protein